VPLLSQYLVKLNPSTLRRYLLTCVFGCPASSRGEGAEFRDNYEKRPVLSATIHPDLKRTLVAMSERTGMSVSQVTDEVLYTGLIDMQEL